MLYDVVFIDMIFFPLPATDQKPEEWSDKESPDSTLWYDILCWYW